MDAKIIEVLKKYEISDLEIDDMLEMAPMLDVTSYEDFLQNSKLLVQYGYPKSDLDFLFLANPNIFVQSVKDLEESLQQLLASCDDIEMALKEDPMLI